MYKQFLTLLLGQSKHLLNKINVGGFINKTASTTIVPKVEAVLLSP
jgi:hypothetical protein